MRNDDLKQWVKKYDPGGCLFTPDDARTNVYLIVKGLVRLVRRENGEEKLVCTVGPGDVLGEAALVSANYAHTLAARIITPLEVIEFDPHELPAIEAKIPDFKLRLIHTLSDRLRKANEFIRILQTKDPHERVTRYVLHYLTYNRQDGGQRCPIIPSEIDTLLQLDQGTAAPALKRLTEQKALTETDGEFFASHLDVLEKILSRWDQRPRG